MAGVKINVKLDILKEVKGFPKKKTLDEAGKYIVKSIKSAASVGKSSTMGERRFVAYKNPDRYPGNRKPKRPVNLYLDGHMFKALVYEPLVSKKIVRIHFNDDEQKKKAKVHLNGLGKVPKRNFMPVKKGEDFTVSIKRGLVKIYKDHFFAMIRKSNK